MIIVWDAMTLEPVRTIFQPHPNGTLSVDVSRDGSQVVSLSNDVPQQISIWDWAGPGGDDASRPLYTATVDEREDVQTCVRFNPGTAQSS
jgi:WD40 repeat protein